jgi:hypothetical protein
MLSKKSLFLLFSWFILGLINTILDTHDATFWEVPSKVCLKAKTLQGFQWIELNISYFGT